jgi:hypothetical protein
MNEIIQDIQQRIKELHAGVYLLNEEKKIEKKFQNNMFG